MSGLSPADTCRWKSHCRVQRSDAGAMTLPSERAIPAMKKQVDASPTPLPGALPVQRQKVRDPRQRPPLIPLSKSMAQYRSCRLPDQGSRSAVGLLRLAAHRNHLRTSNPIESMAATVRHRTSEPGARSQETAKLVLFKLVQGATQLPIVEGVNSTTVPPHRRTQSRAA